MHSKWIPDLSCKLKHDNPISSQTYSGLFLRIISGNCAKNVSGLFIQAGHCRMYLAVLACPLSWRTDVSCGHHTALESRVTTFQPKLWVCIVLFNCEAFLLPQNTFFDDDSGGIWRLFWRKAP